MMHRLVYVSRSLVGRDDQAIADILGVSGARNAACDVTGMLWWGADTFVQVLEGGAAAISETMQRIRNDVRHTDIDVFEDRQASSRVFGRWAMVPAAGDPAEIAAAAYLLGLCAGREDIGAQRIRAFLCDQA